jgi:hypothetical protein
MGVSREFRKSLGFVLIFQTFTFSTLMSWEMALLMPKITSTTPSVFSFNPGKKSSKPSIVIPIVEMKGLRFEEDPRFSPNVPGLVHA